MKRRDRPKLRLENKPPSLDAATSDKLLFRAELAVAALLTLFVVAANVVFLTHAGPLWRDEIHIVNLSNMPTLSEWWELSEHDTFPVVWPAMVHVWTAIGWGQSDFGLRVLGFLVGMGILSLLWWNTWRFGRAPPSVCLVLVALSVTVLHYADSLRGYGCGAW